jgi:hypothetical protein
MMVQSRLPVLAALVALSCAAGCGKSTAPRFDAASAFRYLEQQCRIGPRYPGSPGHRKLQRFLVDELKRNGANVSLQPFDAVLTTGDTLRCINIIANYNLDAKKRVLLGAHYDTRPRADRDPDPARRSEPIVGANDGASGVAVLLEISRLLAASRPSVGVDIVLFDGEDYGEEGVPQDYIRGSLHFAGHLKGYRPYAVIVIDMIGERDVSIRPEGYSTAASGGLTDELFGIAEELGITAFSRESGPTLIDDHLPFIQQGLRTALLVDFDYPYWHTVDDTPDKCEPASLEAVGTVLVEYLWRQ